MGTRHDTAIRDCPKCKEMNSQATRQALGCGYEPKDDRVRLTMWQPPAAYKGPELTVCAGYSTTLPEVRETQIARVHWDKGVLVGDTEELLDAIVVLNGAYNSVDAWRMTPADKGGGREG